MSAGHPIVRSEFSAGSSLEEHLLHLATSDVTRFLVLFKRRRDSQPLEATRVCVRHLAKHGLDAAGRSMRIWLLANSSYLDLLLDPTFLEEADAFRVASLMRDASSLFSLNLQARITQSHSVLDIGRLDRTIRLAAAFVDTGILVPWLRALSEHPDQRIRTRASKTLCVLRPNPRMIERQMKSPDPRVRADAVESLWHAKDPETVELLRTALNDESHRVVVNALIGLYYLRVLGTFEKLLALTQHSSEEMSCAAIWGLGFLGDARAIPTLKDLVQNSTSLVASKAQGVLDKLCPHLEHCEKAETPTLVAEQVPEPLSESKPVATELAPGKNPEPGSQETEPSAPQPDGKKPDPKRSRSMNVLGI